MYSCGHPASFWFLSKQYQVSSLLTVVTVYNTFFSGTHQCPEVFKHEIWWNMMTWRSLRVVSFKYEIWLQYSYVSYVICSAFGTQTPSQQQSLIQASWKWSLDSSNASKWCIVWMRNWKNWTKESWSEDVGDIHLGSTHRIYIYIRIYISIHLNIF